MIARMPVPEALSYECRDAVDAHDYGNYELWDSCEACTVRAKQGSVVEPGEVWFEVFLWEHFEALAEVVVEDVDVRDLLEELYDLCEPI